jgi:hypothetical protein
MGFFKKIFGDSRDDVLAKSDMQMARDEIADFHKMVNERAAREGGEYLFKTEYVAAWQAFRDDPNINTARKFLDEAPNLLQYFQMCSPGHDFYTTSRSLKERGLQG